MTAKEWLMRAWKIDREITSLLKTRQDAYDMCISTTVSIKEDIVSSGSSDPHKYDGYISLSNELNERIDELLKIKAEVSKVIRQVTDITLRVLLIERYINFASWEQIAEDMHYTRRHVVAYLHPKALHEVEIILFYHIT